MASKVADLIRAEAEADPVAIRYGEMRLVGQEVVGAEHHLSLARVVADLGVTGTPHVIHQEVLRAKEQVAGETASNRKVRFM